MEDNGRAHHMVCGYDYRTRSPCWLGMKRICRRVCEQTTPLKWREGGKEGGYFTIEGEDRPRRRLLRVFANQIGLSKSILMWERECARNSSSVRTQIHEHTHTHTHTHNHTFTHTHSLSLARSISRALSLFLSCSRARALSHTHAQKASTSSSVAKG